MEHSSHPNPIPDNTLALMAVKMLGSSIGNANIAVNVELLFVLEAITAVRVRVEEMESTPSTRVKLKRAVFSIGFPKSTVKSKKFNPKIIRSKQALKINFEKIKLAG